VDVSIEKKDFKIGNLKVDWECYVIMAEEFKVKVKELLNLWLGPNSLRNTKILSMCHPFCTPLYSPI
jgi:hypothetical protein